MIDRDADARLLPPHSIEAEQSVLGAVLLNNGVLDRINGDLTPEHFFSDDHRLIYQAQWKLHADGSPIDVTTLGDALSAVGKLDSIGGMSYLGALVQNVPTSANAEHYVSIIRERAELRRIETVARRIAEGARTPGANPGELLAEALGQIDAIGPTVGGWKFPEPITEQEMASASTSPACIVEGYLYADVGALVAPGGTGKTTAMLYESAHIVLGFPLYGLPVRRPGMVLIFTAEDSREIMVARLREICTAMGLTAEQRARVIRDVRIDDVRGQSFKMTRIHNDVVVPSPVIDGIIARSKGHNIAEIVIDPAVSFGVGEARVNDNEQGLVEAARKLVRGLNCCVRYVHHVGKLNAREKAVDQYTGRGGSALPDGCRMVAVMQPMAPDEWRKATGMSLLDGESGTVLARPKVSYAPAHLPNILISRKGYEFRSTIRMETDAATNLHADCEQLLTLLTHDLAKGIRHTQNSLEALGVFESRKTIRATVATLIARGRLEHAQCEQRRKGGANTYLRPVDAAPTASGAPSEKTP